MKIVIAPDSFKGSLSALEVAECLERGFLRADAGLVIEKLPMADGGEGTVRALVDATGGQLAHVRVTGPLGEQVESFFGMLGDGVTGIIEMAAASGLPLVPEGRRNPLLTTTYGTGELIRAALDAGAQKLLIGIGGSATNDCGVGMAQALGGRFLDAAGLEVGWGGKELNRISQIDLTGLDLRIKDVEILVACDVDNPLYGERGAAYIYAPQKGATPEMVRVLNAGLQQIAGVIARNLGLDVTAIPGTGAAGGLGAGLIAFLGGKLRPGIQLVTEAVGLQQRLRGVDVVVTGEGRMDYQTAFGKTPVGVARVAKTLGIPVIAVAGSIGEGARAVYEQGIDAYFALVNAPMTLDAALARTPELLEEAGENIGKLLLIKGGGKV